MHKMERIYVVNWFENMKFIRAEMNISQKYLAVRIFFRIFFGALRIHSLDFIDVALFRFSKICSLAPNAMNKKNRSDRIVPYRTAREDHHHHQQQIFRNVNRTSIIAKAFEIHQQQNNDTRWARLHNIIALFVLQYYISFFV